MRENAPSDALTWARLVLLALAASACSGGDATGPAQYDSIAGTYAGAMAGVTQGVAMEGTFALTITQNQGSLGGSYSMSGQLTDGFDTVDIQGTGTIAGTIASGNNPSINIAIANGFCPNVSSSWSGAYDSANRRITLTGSLPVMNGLCQVVLNYAPMTAILQR